ncbi:hypothetical protein [Nostoc sp. FACHB-892]|uniref:hypothetical protein n=1 Tax=Nostoc sp. FACHB-892 TaxID=2692843 RepID=UPI001685CB09|nr:hypothetical protein [Nostoc sp. FACHB-892]
MVRDASKSFLSAKTTPVRRRSVIAKRETSWVEQFVRSQIIQRSRTFPYNLRSLTF